MGNGGAKESKTKGGKNRKRPFIRNDAIRWWCEAARSSSLTAPPLIKSRLPSLPAPPTRPSPPPLSVVILSRMAGKLDFLSRGRADVISRQSRRSRINSGGASILVTVGLLKGNGDEMRLDEKKK